MLKIAETMEKYHARRVFSYFHKELFCQIVFWGWTQAVAHYLYNMLLTEYVLKSSLDRLRGSQNKLDLKVVELAKPNTCNRFQIKASEKSHFSTTFVGTPQHEDEKKNNFRYM